MSSSRKDDGGTRSPADGRREDGDSAAPPAPPVLASLRVRLLLLVLLAMAPTYGVVLHAGLERKAAALESGGGAAVEAAQADLSRNLLLVSLVAAAALGASWLFGSWFIMDPVNGLLAATRRLASGDLRARREGRRRGGGELERLEEAFDEMAVALEIRGHELRRAEARYREIVEMIPAVFFTGRVEAGIVPDFVSPQARDLTGFPPERFTSEPGFWDSRVDPADADRVRAARQRGLEGGAGYEVEYRLLPVSGEPVWVKERGVAAGSPGPGALRVRGFLSDITGRKALERQFLQAQKMEAVGRLAAGVAHDFNNLITVIGGYGQLLLPRASRDAVMLGHIEEIRKAADRAAALTRQLLHCSRQQEADPVVLDVHEALGALDRMVRRLIGDRIRVASELAATPARIRIDRGHLDQAILNLVVNARDAMADGGLLTFRTEVGEAAVALEVEDTGCGMDEATRERIFEPFFTTKGEGKGTGLGLSTVYGIVRQAGGSIEVRSAPGLGTTFRIAFPRHEAPVDAAPDPEGAGPGEPSHRPLFILVVEDEASIRALTREFLARDGHRVAEASSLSEARQVLARSLGLDLILVDVSLPDGDGGAFAREAVAARPGLRAILTSGYSPSLLGEEGLRGGGDLRFLQKPYRAAQLREAVASASGEGKRGAEAGT